MPAEETATKRNPLAPTLGQFWSRLKVGGCRVPGFLYYTYGEAL